MFLTNSNAKKNNNCYNSDFSLLNSSTQFTNNVNGGGGGGGGFNFPTSILENLLQNSDLLETLMKPISSSSDNNEMFLDEKMCKFFLINYFF